jgi:hypothetical protein
MPWPPHSRRMMEGARVTTGHSARRGGGGRCADLCVRACERGGRNSKLGAAACTVCSYVGRRRQGRQGRHRRAGHETTARLTQRARGAGRKERVPEAARAVGDDVHVLVDDAAAVGALHVQLQARVHGAHAASVAHVAANVRDGDAVRRVPVKRRDLRLGVRVAGQPRAILYRRLGAV